MLYKDLCFNTKADILLPKSKSITTSIFYRPPNQATFMELIVKDFSHSNLKDNEIYLLGNFNINVSQKRNFILNGKGMAACKEPVQTLINIKNFVIFFL